MTAGHGEQCVLIVDDDASFRSLVAQLLGSHGYSVAEARNWREANECVRSTPLGLAIVDYRLPEMDGITWISRLRDAGSNVPVVFLSGTWCDASTFARLRNILRVSLILQKPIVPNLFMEQIHSLLPRAVGPIYSGAMDEHAVNQPMAVPEQLRQERQPQYGTISSQSLTAMERALESSKQEFAKVLPDMVRVLAERVQAAREQGDDRFLLNEVVNEAHKLKGSAGSYGFTKVAESAGKIESLIGGLEPDDGTMQEILWLEIIRHLAVAESSAADIAVQNAPESAADLTSKRKGIAQRAVLLVGDSEDLIDISLGMNSAEAFIANRLQTSLSTLKVERLDAVVVDYRACAEGVQVLQFAKEMRLLPGYGAVPLAFIADEKLPFTQSDLLYIGCSLLIQRPLQLQSFEAAVQRLISLYEPNLPRVLTVDDDPILSRFVERVLSAEGMVVRGLNEPINILEVMDEFKPDVVLLDVIMPGLSGYDVCRLLRANEQWSKLPILFLTSKSDKDGRAAAFEAGADDFLAKPVVSAELISRVKAQITRSPTIRARLSNAVDNVNLLSRAAFEQAFAKAVESARQERSPLTACVLELGGLNDSSRLAAEDQILSVLSSLIQVRFRTQDVRAKLASLFILLFPGQTRKTVEESVRILLSEFQSEKFEDIQKRTFYASFQFGAAQLYGGTPDTDEATQLLQCALERMRS